MNQPMNVLPSENPPNVPQEKAAIKREIEIIQDDSFNYKGFQVVRGEFFSHVFEPCISFNNYKVYVNTACIKKLPNVDYVQILVNSLAKKAGNPSMQRRYKRFCPLVQLHK